MALAKHTTRRSRSRLLSASALALRSRLLSASALVALALSGCAGVPTTAVVDGRTVARPTLELAGDAYTLQHRGAHPRPGGPSSGLRADGGAIRGRICGMYVDLDVQHRGDHVQLVGSLDSSFPVALRVDESGGARHFSGNLGSLGVDLTRDGRQLSGTIGRRAVELSAGTDDAWHGRVHTPELVQGELPLLLLGQRALDALPAADQAALLPALFTCEAGSRHGNLETMTLAVGGAVGERRPGTSAVYTESRERGEAADPGQSALDRERRGAGDPGGSPFTGP